MRTPAVQLLVLLLSPPQPLRLLLLLMLVVLQMQEVHAGGRLVKEIIMSTVERNSRVVQGCGRGERRFKLCSSSR